MWGLIGDVPVRRVCGTIRERRKGYEGGVQFVGFWRLLYVFRAHGFVDETSLVGVVIRDTVGCVESHTRGGDGSDFEVIDY